LTPTGGFQIGRDFLGKSPSTVSQIRACLARLLAKAFGVAEAKAGDSRVEKNLLY
jgi:hypothetical protein